MPRHPFAGRLFPERKKKKPPVISDTENLRLIRLAQGGDTDAMDKLTRVHFRLIWSVCCKMAKLSRQPADEHLTSAWHGFHRAVMLYNPDISRFSTWAVNSTWMVARGDNYNQWVQAQRRAKKATFVPYDENPDDPDAIDHLQLPATDFDHGMAEPEVVHKRLEDIALRVGCTPSAARVFANYYLCSGVAYADVTENKYTRQCVEGKCKRAIQLILAAGITRDELAAVYEP